MTYPTNQIPSTNPQNIAIATPIGLQSAPRDPTPQDNTYVVGSEWQNTVSKMFFKCVSTSFAGAVWTAFIPSAAGTVATLTGNSGGAVGPNGAGNINVVGDGTSITIAGNPGTNTLTASLVGGGVAAQSFTTNVAGPVTPTAAGVLNLNASTSTYTNGATANTVKIELQGTNHALFVGRGALTPATTLPAAINGQLPIGNTGADPTIATLTAGAGISISNGAGSITIAGTGAVPLSFPTDAGTAVPAANMLTITGSTTGLTTTGVGSTVGLTGTLNATHGGTGVSNPAAHTLPVAEGASAFTFLGPLSNGQLLIGSTGLDPVPALLTAGTGISITNGAGSITIAATGTTTFNVTSVNNAASPYTVLTTDNFIACQTSTGAITIRLPNAPATGRAWIIKDSNGAAATNNITVTTVGGAVLIDGSASQIIKANYQSISVLFDGTAYEIY